MKCGPENLVEEKTAKPVQMDLGFLVRLTNLTSGIVFINISHNNFLPLTYNWSINAKYFYHVLFYFGGV